MKCGEQYSPQHRCPKQIPLHVMEEVLDVLQLDGSNEGDNDGSIHDSDEELLSLSQHAVEGLQVKKTMRFQGLIGNCELLILVDSGSSTTFIAEELVQQLQLPTREIAHTQVTVADGSRM